MICPQCGTENQPKFKFCVKCGCNLEDPAKVNYEQVDMGGYHSEDDYSEDDKSGFKIGGGTFKISDTPAPTGTSSDLYTADELNDTDEEFDFSSFDEPFIPKLDADRIAVPRGNQPQQPNMQGMPGMPYGMPAMQGMPQMQGMAPQQPQGMQGIPQMQGMPPQQPQGIQGMPQMQGMVPQQPQIIGYDQNGTPIYAQAQPMMYAQPQIIGYDQNGTPIFAQAQPMMYAQPQIVGYDQNGTPIYAQAQPMMYAQPQIIGYDQNGTPIYAQAQPMMYPQGMPQMQTPYGTPPQPQAAPEEPKKEERVDVPDDFWAFFDGGKATEHHDNDASSDFFGKHNDNMDSISAASADMGQLKRFEHKKVDYMGDTPLVDASKLAHNDVDKFNKFYMRQADTVDADTLEQNVHEKTQDIMGVTAEVNASDLAENRKIKHSDFMGSAGTADPSELEAYVREHKTSMMSEADYAVEALPKKKNSYNDEIDAIELPDYMQARKTVRSGNDTAEIPGLPDL